MKLNIEDREYVTENCFNALQLQSEGWSMARIAKTGFWSVHDLVEWNLRQIRKPTFYRSYETSQTFWLYSVLAQKSKGQQIAGHLNTLAKYADKKNLTLDETNEVVQALRGVNSVHKVVQKLDYLSVSFNRARAEIPYQCDQLRTLHGTFESDGEFIEYFPSWWHLRHDKPVKMKLGKYLMKYIELTGMAEWQVKDFVDRWKAYRGIGKIEVKFAAHDDPDEWVRVYDDGPHSCMQGEDCVGVYAHSKSVLNLAYIELGEDKDIIARAIVRNDSNKGYVRIYPDPQSNREGQLLKTELEKLGFGKQINLAGCLLEAEDHQYGGYVCPYIDDKIGGGSCGEIVYIDGSDYIRIGSSGFDLQVTEGRVETIYCECDECGTGMDEDDYTYSEYHDRRICHSCIEDEYVYAHYKTRRGMSMQDYIHKSQCTYCESDGEWYLDEDLGSFDVYQCEGDGNYYHIEDLYRTSGGWYSERYVVRLDVEQDGGEYAYAYELEATETDRDGWVHDSEVRTLSNGETCHESNVEDYEAEILAELENQAA